jgi:hypothetical protein
MTLNELDNLELYQKVGLRDGRIGVYQGIHDFAKENNNAFIIVNVLPEGSIYSRDEAFWPAQIKYGG